LVHPLADPSEAKSNVVRWGQVKGHPLRASRHLLGTGHCIGRHRSTVMGFIVTVSERRQLPRTCG
jgi:hypothetical protein